MSQMRFPGLHFAGMGLPALRLAGLGAALALLLVLLLGRPAGAASPRLAADPAAASPAAEPATGLFDIGDGHLLFVPGSIRAGRPAARARAETLRLPARSHARPT